MNNGKFTIRGMTCGSCAMKIEDIISNMDGVESAQVDFKTSTLTTVMRPDIDISHLKDAIASAGNYTLTDSKQDNTFSGKEKTDPSIYTWFAFGLVGITIIFYLVQTLGMQSFTAPLEFMSLNWYLVSPLVLAFGIQMGLFRAIRLKNKERGGVAITTSGGLSTGTMLACCAHNLVLLVPVLGLSALAATLAAYQTSIFLASIAVAYGAVYYMWHTYKKVHSTCNMKS